MAELLLEEVVWSSSSWGSTSASLARVCISTGSSRLIGVVINIKFFVNVRPVPLSLDLL